jgi:hypothetical protein
VLVLRAPAAHNSIFNRTTLGCCQLCTLRHGVHTPRRTCPLQAGSWSGRSMGGRLEFNVLVRNITRTLLPIGERCRMFSGSHVLLAPRWRQRQCHIGGRSSTNRGAYQFRTATQIGALVRLGIFSLIALGLSMSMHSGIWIISGKNQRTMHTKRPADYKPRAREKQRGAPRKRVRLGST